MIHPMIRPLAAAALFACLAAGGPVAQDLEGSATGLPVPRFVSLKSSPVNVRIGPSRDHAVAWTYMRSGLPIEITQEFENWRRVRDWEGAEGWVLGSLLSGTRTVMIAPWDTSATARPVYSSPDEGSSVVALVDPKVQASADGCDGSWCELEGAEFSGYIQQSMLWGVYPDEIVE